MREVHLVEDHEVWDVLPSGALRSVEGLDERRLGVAALEGVVVAEEILAVAPPGLHLDDVSAALERVGYGHRERGLPRTADALDHVKAARRQPGDEHAQ